MLPGKLNDLTRAIDMLRGIVQGIAIDYQISDAEIGQLTSWLTLHANLLRQKPFCDLSKLLHDILEDGVVDEDEREELLDWCHQSAEQDSSAVLLIKNVTRMLHGVLQGISMDQQISTEEVQSLRDWLLEYEYLKHLWPFDETWDTVERILQDSSVSSSEQEFLLDFCARFSEESGERDEVKDSFEPKSEFYMSTDAPILQTVSGICEKEPVVLFTNRLFCFTGHARTGGRKELQAVVEGLGGASKSAVTLDLNYLVVGALSQPCWVYSSYGRKIERAIENKKRGAPTQIIHEDDFIRAAANV